MPAPHDGQANGTGKRTTETMNTTRLSRNHQKRARNPRYRPVSPGQVAAAMALLAPVERDDSQFAEKLDGASTKTDAKGQRGAVR